MVEEKYVVLSINDKSSKDIAKTLSNDTARIILEKLATKHHSPNQLSKSLNIPLSTIQYNLDLLKKSGMIRSKGYNYSKKGRRVDYYEPARKLIVIAPEESSKSRLLEALKDKLVLLISSLAVGVGYFGQQAFTKPAAIIVKQTTSLAAGADLAGAPAETAMNTVPITLPTYDLYIFLAFTIAFVSSVLYFFWQQNKS